MVSSQAIAGNNTHLTLFSFATILNSLTLHEHINTCTQVLPTPAAKHLMVDHFEDGPANQQHNPNFFSKSKVLSSEH